MGNLRKLEYRLAELLGWELVGCQWYNPRGERQEPPFWARDPAACADLDGEMKRKGFFLKVERDLEGYCWAEYSKLNGISGTGKGYTEQAARTWAAIAAMEKAKGEGNQ